MKIKTLNRSYEEVMALPRLNHRLPDKQSVFMRKLIRGLSINDLKKVNFTWTEKGMESIGKGQPCLYLMNHSCFKDLEVAVTVIGDKPLHIVCTSDGFVGKDKLLRAIGCFPTQKFVTDLTLVKDMVHVTKKLQSSVLMYPEASYSFDGTATPLPEGVGKCIKMLKVPVVMIRTHGAFLHDPLYNGLQLRKTDITAEVECILTPEDTERMTVGEINTLLTKHFTFDHFKEQQERRIRIDEAFRADGLHRVLYKCPCCGKEQQMLGQGIMIRCQACGAAWELSEYGKLLPIEGTCTEKEETAGDRAGAVELTGKDGFTHIPDWYAWERAEARKEVEAEDYQVRIPVDIIMVVDTKAAYRVGEGELTHTREGFTLIGCQEKLQYSQKPKASYSLYADYFWYEIGDMVCIGDKKALYYCFPKDKSFPVAKLRLATEELYKLN